MVVEKAQAFVDAGCSAFVNWYRDFPSSDSMEGWMTDVVPQLRLPTATATATAPETETETEAERA
jgi:hypothetical protein